MRSFVPFRRSAGPLLIVLAACSPSDRPPDGADRDPAEEATAEASTPTLGPADGHDLPGVALDRIQVGDVAPDFTLESYDDGLVTLSDYRGRKNVILVFYRGHW